MIVRFGLDFDGMLPLLEETRLGFVVAGPSLFLSILETQLGIIADAASVGARIVQYRACLNKANSPERFYHRSFASDELGVARELLLWRDAWYMAGWEGAFTGTVGRRLQDMADVEALARERVKPSFGERLAAVLKTLEKRRTQIEQVELVDDPEDCPLLWRRVLEKLTVRILRVDEKAPNGQDGTDLARIQQTLTFRDNKGEDLSKTDLSGDGSVLVLRAGSRSLSARLLAVYIKTKRIGLTAVLTGASGYALDEALESVDLPKCGFAPFSVWRPPLQILPLALGLLWKPLDPGILSQFLNLPIGPLPRRIRVKLAAVVAKYPGIGGPEWQDTVESFLESERKDKGADDNKAAEIADAIAYWLKPERFDPETGADTTSVAERCKRVADYLALRLGTAKEDSVKVIFASANRQASDLSAAVDQLREQGKERISRQQLERLLTFISGIGSSLAGRQAEVGHVLAAESPAVFGAPQDEVIWWDLSMPDLPKPAPWTRVEIDALKRQGVSLDNIDHELQRLARTWLRPIRFARKRLIFVLHSSDENHHPVWDRISSACKGWMELEIEEFVRNGKTIPGIQVKTTPLSLQPLPPLRRWWQLPDGAMLAARETESFSSLDAFIKSPYQWVLGHKAKLHAGRLEALASGNQLKGNLVHRLIEYFFNRHPGWRNMKDGQIITWLEDILQKLLEEEGATLLKPGRAVEKEQFLDLAQRALLALVKSMNEARVTDVRVEHHESTRFIGGELEGNIDLVLTDDKGKEKIVDVKWGGYKYRIDELRQNRSLQLAVYAYLCKTRAGLSYWPAQANFIIEGARLLAQDNKAFPDAFAVGSESGEGVSDLWKRFEVTWRWRRAQIDQGLLEVTVTGTEPTEDSSPPENGLAIDDHNDAFNDFFVLTGWEVDK